MEKYLGRVVLKKVIFENNNQSETNPFEAFYKAQKWCRDNNYSYGEMCHPQPIVLKKGYYEWIAKWKNLNKRERNSVDGVMIGRRGSDYTIYIFN